MAVKVIISRNVMQGRQARELIPLLLQMRSHALKQPGYISGETLCDLENPGDCLVISQWETENDWNRWKNSKERAAIDKKIESLTGKTTQYKMYASMSPLETK